MPKELNETLVMTTCECRENNKNLVMTRAYLEDLIRHKETIVRNEERKRIFDILKVMIEGEKNV
jgi:hypothetical protein